MMQPQNSLAGARAGTVVPQANPPQLSANKVGMQAQQLQQNGMGISQAMNKAAQNPGNQYAKGGDTSPPPPTPTQIASNIDQYKDSPDIPALAKALQGVPAVTQPKTAPAGNDADPTEQMFKDYENPDYQAARAKLVQDQKPQKMAQGGAVHENIKNMPLKDIIKLLASHPELGGAGGGNVNSPLSGNQMAAGGAVGGQGEPDAMAKKPAHTKSEARSHGLGLLNMNADVQTYDQGGPVNPSDVTGNNDFTSSTNTGGFNPKANPSISMATGGTAEEEDSIVGYGPDGTPIIQNPDGTEQYGDVNQELGRPESASTLGTGAAPTNALTGGAANSVAQQQAPMNAMAQGGEEAPPPGSLSKEVADDVPAKLSEGEFVFSADVVRYYGLRLLNGLMDHARTQLSSMANEGGIRSPGDGKNPDDKQGMLGQFMQDKEPNMHAYDNKDGTEASDLTDVDGLLKECMGGSVAQHGMAEGGGVFEEEQYKAGGPVSQSNKQYGRDNMVSAHPKGGDVLQDYARGGTVSSVSSSLTPKKFNSFIPADKLKVSNTSAPKIPSSGSFGAAFKMPKVAKGGLMKKNVNQSLEINAPQSIVGA